jgi:hypothetical protein
MTIYTFVDDLLTYLQTNNLGTKTVDLFDGALPPSPLNCITISPYGGTNPTTIKSGEDDPHNPFLNVAIRNTNKTTALINTIKIYELWRKVPNITIGNTRFELIKAQGTWHPLGLDNSSPKCMNYSINFSLKFE